MSKLVLFLIVLSVGIAVCSNADLTKPIPGTKFVMTQSHESHTFKPLDDEESNNQDIENAKQDGGFFINCHYGKADLNPLQSNTGYSIINNNNNRDYNFTYQCAGGVCDLIINFCRTTMNICQGYTGIAFVNVRGGGCRMLLAGNWEMVDVYEQNYNNSIQLSHVFYI